MDMLWLSREQAETIVQHALADAPLEACGLIIGSGQRVKRVVPIRNIASDPRRRYVMDPEELARHLSEIYSIGCDFVGFYHSHPDGAPVFSETDQRESNWYDHIYLIVGLKGRTPRLAAWKMQPGRVFPVDIHIGDDNPETDNDRLSSVQRIAILTTGLIVLVMMLVLSFHLLPPAPPIP